MTYRSYQVYDVARGIVCDRCEAKAIPHKAGSLSDPNAYAAAVRAQGWLVGYVPNASPSKCGPDLCPGCAATVATEALRPSTMIVSASDLANPEDLR